MDTVFIKLLNMSITASWLVLAVILLRFLLKKAPKWIMGVLWGFVAIRLICPFSPESIFSIVPSTEPIPQNIILSENPAINSGLPILNEAINPILSESLAPNVGDSITPMQMIASVASAVWMVGILAMFLYTLISYVRIHRKVGEAVPLKENIWICDHISTPFILGMIRPRIYLPSSMNEGDMEYVISHEKAHLKRKDHIWKPLGFLLLSVYWFNPILWVAYILLCRDIELACDEKVIRQFGTEIKKPYTDALINCSVPRKVISACPLAFGEAGVKERVKGVLSYKKPAFWIIIVAVLVCIATAVCLLTSPKNYDADDLDDQLQVFLDMEIKEHHQSDQTNGNFAVLDYKIMKVDRWLSDTTLYMWVLYEEYSYKDGILQEEAGSYIPTVITVTNTIAQNKNGKNSYELREYWEPRNGSYYESDIKEKFPQALWSQAIDGQQYVDELQENCMKHAMEYYGISESEVGGADEPNTVITNPSFNAEVLEVSEEVILVKPDSDSNEIKSADKISVSLDSISTIPIPTFSVGDRVRVIYNGEIAETYPAKINKAFGVYLLSDDGKVLSPTPIN